ncbi:MAG: hypothetical protein ABR955_15915 [Verrucomicrobiota bacterium]
MLLVSVIGIAYAAWIWIGKQPVGWTLQSAQGRIAANSLQNPQIPVKVTTARSRSANDISRPVN